MKNYIKPLFDWRNLLTPRHIFNGEPECDCCGCFGPTEESEPCRWNWKMRLLSPLERVFIRLDCEYGPGPLYMVRWWIWGSSRRSVLGTALMVHLFVRSDGDDELHDHPWFFISIPLSSGYFERTTKGTFWRRRFVPMFRKPTYQHSVQLKDGKPTWTICLRFWKVRTWGFIRDGIWTKWNVFEAGKKRAICDKDVADL